MKAGWKTVRLNDVCDIVKGRKPNLRTTPNKGDLPYLVARYIRGLEDPEYGSPLEKGVVTLTEADTVIICDGSNSGEVFTGLNGIMSSTMGKVVKKTEIYDPYLRHFLSSTFELFNGTKTGSAIPHLDKDAFRKLEIPLPPLAEQKRIVALLDEAFAGIDEAKAKAELSIQDAEILFESYLQSVFQDHEQGWVQKRLGDLVTRLTNGYVGPTRNIYQESGVPYLLARHVKNNRLNFDGRTFISQEFNLKNKKSLLKTGDVLLVQSGHIGHCAVVTDEHDGHNCHAMIVITATKGSFIGPFLSLFFNSSGMKRKFEQIRSGSTVPHLTCGEIRELMIPLPTFEIQKSIVDRANVLDECILQLRSSLANRLSAYDELKKSLLIQAFAGALTA
jgi:type I restriction enzyme S subunit